MTTLTFRQRVPPHRQSLPPRPVRQTPLAWTRSCRRKMLPSELLIPLFVLALSRDAHHGGGQVITHMSWGSCLRSTQWLTALQHSRQVRVHELSASIGCRKQEDKDRAWSSRESAAMKRDALLDCLDTARDCYRHAWARTSVDIAIQARASPLSAPAG